MLEADVNLHKRTPFRPLGLTNQAHARFGRRAIGLLGITRHTRANDVFPGRRATTIAWNDMIEIQVLAVELSAAILAGVAVALENVVPRELHFLLGHAVEQHQQDHARNATSERD